jgi:hypothetical protein
VLGANRSASTGTVTRSFSGQGHEIWENAPAARNVVPATRALSNIRSSFSNSVARNPAGRLNTSLAAGSRLGGSLRNPSSAAGFGAGSASNRGIISSFPRSNSGFAGFRGNHRFGFPFRGFRGRCWNCGFGFGWWPNWGFGFGWPWFGYWDSYPHWGDPWLWGWPGYGNYDYPANYNIYNDDNSYNDDSSYNVPQSSPGPADNYASADQDVSAQEETIIASDSGDNSATEVLLYLKDGAVYSAQNFWIMSGKLHFTIDNGGENAINTDQLDMQRTVDENAKRGVHFAL